PPPALPSFPTRRSSDLRCHLEQHIHIVALLIKHQMARATAWWCSYTIFLYQMVTIVRFFYPINGHPVRTQILHIHVVFVRTKESRMHVGGFLPIRVGAVPFLLNKLYPLGKSAAFG